MRTTIEVIGARENNLKNIHVVLPRDRLIVLTGLSGSGKSSLAFETIYAEAQRRFLESLSSYSRRFVEQLKKPDVDFVYGLSPVVSIEQKTAANNPRSTVGTMTDISSYLNLLFALAGQAHCPYTGEPIPSFNVAQIVERIVTLPPGTEVEIRAPVWKIYGEDYPYLFGEIRSKGYKRLYVDDELIDLSEESTLDEDRTYRMEVLVDRFLIGPEIEKSVKSAIRAVPLLGEHFLRIVLLNADAVGVDEEAFYAGFASSARVTMLEPTPGYFQFNNPEAACSTCSGLGTYLQVHPDLLVPDKRRSIREGAFVREAFVYNPDAWGGRIMYSLAQHYGFSLDTPWEELPETVREILLYGTKGERFPLRTPPEAKRPFDREGEPWRFDGVATQIDRTYRRYRRRAESHSGMEEWLRRVMVEHDCPECGGTRLRGPRLLVTIGGKNIHELGEMQLSDLREFLAQTPIKTPFRAGAETVLREILARLDILLGIGLDYLSLNRKSGTLSGGEAQRIRLSTQIGSGLMGMLYVLDEPSIGLHPRDNEKMIQTLRRLRDIGNTVIVVEHDEETIRAADHILELGPGPGVHGGEIVAQGSVEEVLNNPASLTGQYLSGRKRIEVPTKRRQPQQSRWLRIRGARENNLKNIDVEIPLGLFVCITGASGSGKSTLINEILYKKLHSVFYDSRTIPGDHDAIEGLEQLTDVVNIDQSPIGRTPKSNPATYVGVFDSIRKLFAQTPEAQRRGYQPGRFSFNVKGGRCEECSGEGVVTTSLHFMPDVEVPCPVCRGARFNEETLEVLYKEKSIAEVLEMTIEEAVEFFADVRPVARKLQVLDDLGLGYLRLGQSSTTLSGGEAQRVKLATELGKVKRGAHKLYLLDEPTTGLHLADIQRLLDCLNRLVQAGNTVVVIEHHLDVIKCADWVIDLGPEGGHNGGEVLIAGPPEEIAACERSYTGRYLRRVLPTKEQLRPS
ncbi:MAG: UvrABC system protein A [Candidatus Poribacteria bacterium]|nr:MAG: UvrABC system protein A [Candidatus Poribacteria bacterium]